MAWFRFTPLGGLGRMGGNCAVYETEHDLIVADCGTIMPNAFEPGIDQVIPDLRYVESRRHKCRAIVLTHGHEDHIGALPYVLQRLPVPVYGTRFTQALVRNKLSDHPHLTAQLTTFKDRELLQFGTLQVDPVAVTHSIPDAVALVIKTPLGNVVHTGDFKIDNEPLTTRLTDEQALADYGKEGILALLSDSTNAERGGWSPTEASAALGLRQAIQNAPGRVVVTTFASNIARLQSVIDASWEVGRTVVPIGRSLVQYLQTALAEGYLRAEPGSLADPTMFDLLPRTGITLLASGSQGERIATMARLARDDYPSVRLQAGDRVIISARCIPGNEKQVGVMLNDLMTRGIEVIDAKAAPVHTSGHASVDEQKRMIELCSPRYFLPLHGENRQLLHHARTAEAMGIPSDRILVASIGQPVVWEETSHGISARFDEPVAAGTINVDGSGIGDVDDTVLKDRLILGQSGVVVCAVATTSDGLFDRVTDLQLLGITADEGIADDAAHALESALDEGPLEDESDDLAQAVRASLKRFFKKRLERRPLIVVTITSSDIDA